MRNDTRYEIDFVPNGICNVAAAVIGAGAIGAVGSSMAASSAADAQSEAADKASATQLGMFNRTQANLKPYMDVGAYQIDQLNQMAASPEWGGKFTNADLNENMAPNYQFQLQQGQQALQNSQSARDGVMSGAAMKDMQNFTQNTAAGAYQNAYSNWLSTQNLRYGQRANLASLGQNAAAMVGNAGVQTGQAIGNNMIGAGNAQAAGAIATGNAISGAANNAAGYYQLNNMMGGGGFGGGTSTASLSPSDVSGFSSGSGFMSGGAYGFGGV